MNYQIEKDLLQEEKITYTSKLQDLSDKLSSTQDALDALLMGDVTTTT